MFRAPPVLFAPIKFNQVVSVYDPKFKSTRYTYIILSFSEVQKHKDFSLETGPDTSYQMTTPYT